MQKNPLFQKRSIVRIATALWLLLCIFWFPGCNGNKSDKEEKTEAINGNGQTQSASFKMNCVTLTKDQMQQKITAAGTKKLKVMLLQCHSLASSSLSTNMQLMAYPGQSINNVGYVGKDLLSIDRTCGPIDFPIVQFANNIIDLVEYGIVKADGTIGDFTTVRFIPSAEHAPVISFVVELVLNKKVILTKKTNPCPPCEYCTRGCLEEAEDSR